METYLHDQKSRVMEVKAEVIDHVEQREDEATTVFGEDQTDLRDFQSVLRDNRSSNTDKTGSQSEQKLKQGVNSEENGGISHGTAHFTLNDRLQRSGPGFTSGLTGGHVVENVDTIGLSEPRASWMASATNETTQITNGARSTIEVKMPKFSGDITQFEEWSNAFQALVHETKKSPVEKMGLLKASLEGEARLLISGYGNSSEHYLEALRVIGEVYGDPVLLVEAHQKEIESLPKVKPRDLASLSRFAFSLQGHLLTICQMIGEKDSLWGHLVRMVERKLDQETYFAWDSYSERLQDQEKLMGLSKWLLERVKKTAPVFPESRSGSNFQGGK